MLDVTPEFGAIPLSKDRCRFTTWAPGKSTLSLVLCGSDRKVVSMQARCGFHTTESEAWEGVRYVFRMPNGEEFPDPASRFQPDGIHGPSSIADHSYFEWSDAAFEGHSLRDMVIYELHIGTFTPEGSFDAAISRLSDLAELGITAIELMPVAQFPGKRNWGYDGVFPFAVQSSYGGPTALQRFVDAAHSLGLSVILDVVYNHLGPEGNYLGRFGPYFTERYSTPWGPAINYDGPDSEPVRAFFIQNALYWLQQFHFDGLRLDAVHGVFDFGAHHFLAEVKERVEGLAARTKRPLHIIAESDLNDVRLLNPPARGGHGLDAQWSDDFHHALHSLLTGETSGYYGDFGSLDDLGVAIRDGWRYSGQYSRFRKRRHGNSPVGIGRDRFVVFSQNHDQVGNRAGGERLATLVDFESLKLAAGLTLLSPFVPLIFMGEEYGETRPFQYFTSHSDPELVDAVRKGRREEFSSFGFSDQVPDPQDEATFTRSVLNYAAKDSEPHSTLRRFYRSLIAFRKRFALSAGRPEIQWDTAQKTLTLEYCAAGVAVIFHFGEQPVTVNPPGTAGTTTIVLNSADRDSRDAPVEPAAHPGPDGKVWLAPRSFVLFTSNTGQRQ
jgi:maltooligosyltrehalose trehalohydrolase